MLRVIYEVADLFVQLAQN